MMRQSVPLLRPEKPIVSTGMERTLAIDSRSAVISNHSGKVHDVDATKIVIDHHQDPQEFADLYFIDTDSCSTCQLIYEFIEKLDELDKELSIYKELSIFLNTNSATSKPETIPLDF